MDFNFNQQNIAINRRLREIEDLWDMYAVEDKRTDISEQRHNNIKSEMLDLAMEYIRLVEED